VSVTFSISLDAIGMEVAIDLDTQFGGRAVEIENVWTDRNLLSEMPT
jgi:hypothetical protein